MGSLGGEGVGRDLDKESTVVAAGKARAEAMRGVIARIEKRILVIVLVDILVGIV